MNREEREARAMARFNILNLSRFAAIAFVIFGVVVISGNLFPDAPPALGYTLFIIGVIDFFLMPILLRKIWAQSDADRGDDPDILK